MPTSSDSTSEHYPLRAAPRNKNERPIDSFSTKRDSRTTVKSSNDWMKSAVEDSLSVLYKYICYRLLFRHFVNSNALRDLIIFCFTCSYDDFERVINTNGVAWCGSRHDEVLVKVFPYDSIIMEFDLGDRSTNVNTDKRSYYCIITDNTCYPPFD